MHVSFGIFLHDVKVKSIALYQIHDLESIPLLIFVETCSYFETT